MTPSPTDLTTGAAAAAGVAPVGSEAPEVAWVLAPPRPGWGEVAVPPPPQDLAAVVPRGRDLFARLCVACHGPEGRGDGVLAPDLPARPRDLAGGRLRTRSAGGRAPAGDVFRTLTAGAPRHGMPAFDHLPAADRWALAAFVRELAVAEREAATAAGEPPPARPAGGAALDPGEHAARGAAVFASQCAACHGAAGDGRGPAAAALRAALRDDHGDPCPPTDLTHGPDAFRGGARPEDVARTVWLGRPGTPMAAQALPRDDLWAVADFVAGLARDGLAARRGAWQAFFEARRAQAALPGARVVTLAEAAALTPPPAFSFGGGPGSGAGRWDPGRSARFAVAPEGAREQGCLACHDGIAAIATGAMHEAILAVAGGDASRACTVCHEGDAQATAREGAHARLVGNPGSLWVTSLGLGCGKCHSSRGALTSLMGLPLPEPVGGGLLAVTSRRTDPSGASGHDHAYRIQRTLMAQETGKVYLATLSAGLVAAGAPRYTDFPVDDPDGAVPAAGSEAYRAFIARAIALGHVVRLDRGAGLPAPRDPAAVVHDAGALSYVDYFRKECARCHLWGEGSSAEGERRSSGCSACHVLNDARALSQGGDPTVPRDRPGHPLRHELTLAIPESQCNHCHTRGTSTLHSDAHQVAGIECVDCHTSLDVHGDGNLYPTIQHQVEVECEDCHGTPGAAPWDLPLGHGTPAAGEQARGTYERDGVRYLLTGRGNARATWVREGDQALVVSLADGARHVVPLLSAPRTAPGAPDAPGGAADPHGPSHRALSCAACHGSRAPRCMPCHVTYFEGSDAQDYLLSAADYDPATTRQRPVLTPGQPTFRSFGSGLGAPELRRDRTGRLAPRIPGCDVAFTRVAPDGRPTDFEPHMNFMRRDYPPPVAPGLPHELSLSPRTCQECHVDGPGGEVLLPGQRRR